MLNKTKLSQNHSGFTLLEVIIALAILVIALGSIIAVEGGSINAAARAKTTNIVSMLAKNQMIETEFKIQGKTFEEVQKEEAGTFDPPFEEYKWKTVVKELKFPQIGGSFGGRSEGSKDSGAATSSSGGGAGGGDLGNQNTDLVTKLITNFLSKSLREVTVTILWKRGTSEQSYSITTWWVDLNHDFQLSE